MGIFSRKKKEDKNGTPSEKEMEKLTLENKKKEEEAIKREEKRKETVKPQITYAADAVKAGMHILDVIAPQIIEVEFDHLKINNTYYRTLFVSGYPRFVSPGWLNSIINFNASLDIAFFIYPVDIKGILESYRHKIAEMEAELATDLERGKIINPTTQAKLDDAMMLQNNLVKGKEHLFEFAFYITLKGADVEHLNYITRQIESSLGALLINAKHTSLETETSFTTTLPFGQDNLFITRNMDTTSLATTFPLTTNELSNDEGILYGINPQNDSFIIFDRFSLENSNMTIFATSGSGKSYLVKLESLRSLMMGTEVIVIDPESEYRKLAEAVGGEYITFSFASESKINPFDLSQIYDKTESQLGLKLLSLHALLKVVMGSMSPTQEALLDRALVETYKAKGITQDPLTQDKEPPLMEDLYKILIGMEIDDAMNLASRIEKFVKGSFVGIFDHQTNINLQNPFTVFSVRELEDSLRPVAMFMILDYIWTRVRRDLKRRLLVIDEAWHMMQHEDSAQFLWSIVKRARKYYLGITTITQDVEDFLNRDIGRAVVTNSALRVLLKQSPAGINKVGDTFYLSQGERQLLLGANIGEGIFFAGNNHAPIQVVASPEEHQLITTDPRELFRSQGFSPYGTPTNIGKSAQPKVQTADDSVINQPVNQNPAANNQPPVMQNTNEDKNDIFSSVDPVPEDINIAANSQSNVPINPDNNEAPFTKDLKQELNELNR